MRVLSHVDTEERTRRRRPAGEVPGDARRQLRHEATPRAIVSASRATTEAGPLLEAPNAGNCPKARRSTRRPGPATGGVPFDAYPALTRDGPRSGLAGPAARATVPQADLTWRRFGRKSLCRCERESLHRFVRTDRHGFGRPAATDSAGRTATGSAVVRGTATGVGGPEPGPRPRRRSRRPPPEYEPRGRSARTSSEGRSPRGDSTRAALRPPTTAVSSSVRDRTRRSHPRRAGPSASASEARWRRRPLLQQAGQPGRVLVAAQLPAERQRQRHDANLPKVGEPAERPRLAVGDRQPKVSPQAIRRHRGQVPERAAKHATR